MKCKECGCEFEEWSVLEKERCQSCLRKRSAKTARVFGGAVAVLLIAAWAFATFALPESMRAKAVAKAVAKDPVNEAAAVQKETPIAKPAWKAWSPKNAVALQQTDMKLFIIRVRPLISSFNLSIRQQKETPDEQFRKLWEDAPRIIEYINKGKDGPYGFFECSANDVSTSEGKSKAVEESCKALKPLWLDYLQTPDVDKLSTALAKTREHVNLCKNTFPAFSVELDEVARIIPSDTFGADERIPVYRKSMGMK